MNLYITFQMGNLAPESIKRDQPDELYVGPFEAADLDHGTLTVYDEDLDYNRAVAHADEALYESDVMVSVWRIVADEFSALAPFAGMVWSRAIIHEASVAGEHRRPGLPTIPLYERVDPSEPGAPGNDERRYDESVDIHDLFRQVREHPDYVFGTIFVKGDFPNDAVPGDFPAGQGEDQLAEAGNTLIFDLVGDPEQEG